MRTPSLFPVLLLAAFARSAPAQAQNRFDPNRLPAPVTDADYFGAGKLPAARVELGRSLFFDKLLSGNRNISCATCHHPRLATTDGLALPFGEGPPGLGHERRPGRSVTDAVYERVPRNSPALFNLGALEFTRMFHDGRVELDVEGYYEGGFVTPARWKLPVGLASALAAQAMFPGTSPSEMAGQQGENPLADARALNKVAGPGGVWEQLAARLRAIPEYVDLFRAAFPDQIGRAEDITFVHTANAIAAFETEAFRADGSPFDRFLREGAALADDARSGMELFYGRAGCSSCHSGKFQTDHEFHAIAMPQIGPGKSDGWDASYWSATGQKAFPEDFGRGRVTTRIEDRYRFRTPSLRNVAHTGPWGHAGSYDTLEAVVRHHLNPVDSLEAYAVPDGLLDPIDDLLELRAASARLERRRMSAERRADFLRRDTWVMSQPALRANIAAANELGSVALDGDEVADLLAFLESLTDPASLELDHLVPHRVPSGLPVDD